MNVEYFGVRLKLERERLGLSVVEMAELGGVSRGAQYNYESDIRQPDTKYLARVAQGGVDVLYVLTGQHKGDPELKPDEAALLDNYRNSPEEGKNALRETGAAFAQSKKAKGNVA